MFILLPLCFNKKGRNLGLKVSSRKLSSEEVDALIEGLQSDDNGKFVIF